MSEYTYQPFFAPSTDGIHTLSGRVYLPQGAPRGFFQVVHGMTEHIARYDILMRALAAVGYLVFGYDHLGHGDTAHEGEHGFIASRGGDGLLAKDVAAFSSAVFSAFGRQSEPYILMGHSMGSFVVRRAVTEGVRPDRLIIMGTGGKNPLAGIGLALIALIRAARGERHISSFVDGIAFGSYNKRFGGGSAEDPKPWLTRDADIRAAYYADPYCSFCFTVSAMGDLVRLIRDVNRASAYRATPHGLPILLVSGEEDPVGNYGDGVRRVAEAYQKAGMQVTLHLYPEARHEILNDVTYDRVLADILAFCEA